MRSELESYRLSTAEREAIEQAVKAADASVSNRRIARMLGVHPSTVDEDVAGNPARGQKNANENNGAENASAGNPAPGLSGAQVAGIVARREARLAAKERQRASVEPSTATIVHARWQDWIPA